MPSLSGIVVDIIRLTVWLAVLAVIFVPIERLFELSPRRRDRAALVEDLGFYFFNSIVPAIVLALPVSLLIAAAHRLLPAGYFDWLNHLPVALQIVATLIVGEIGFYWGHRWSHEWSWMWRFHAVHHRPEGLDWLINTRAHPVDMVFGRLCGLVPIYMLGLAGRGSANGNLPAVIFTIVGVIWGFLLHANVRWRLGWIDRLVATPRFHHWHHSREEHINRNYASMLPLMDRVFGTLHMPKGGAFPKEYGVSRTVGVEPPEAERRQDAVS